MTIQYNTKINEDLQDVTLTLIISFFLGLKNDVQIMKQDDLSKLINIPLSTLKRNLKKLKDRNYINYKAIGKDFEKITKFELLEKAKKYINQLPTEQIKKSVGRPKGYKVSAATKARISKGMKYYYANMTKEQEHIRNNCNRIKAELYRKAMQEYYHDLLN